MNLGHALFGLSEEELRALGYRVVDQIVEHHCSIESKPVSRQGAWEDLERELRVPFQEEGEKPEQLLDAVLNQVLCRSMLSNHPRFLGFVPSPANPVSAFIEALVAAYNPFMGAWCEASGPTMVELNVLDWVGELIGFSSDSGGQITSGGTAATLIGLACARHHHFPDGSFEQGRVYLSAHTHCSISRNLGILGFRPDQIQTVDVDRQGRMRVDLLGPTLTRDKRKGLKPFCCIATAGTTNTGAVDPLSDLAKLCEQEGLWLHVDAAFGGASLLTEEGKELLQGIERADTVVIDGHKWLFQPFELGIVVARDSARLKAAFQMNADYTDDLEGELKLSDYGLQLSRSFKALKLWFTLRLAGRQALRIAVKSGLEAARTLERLLDGAADWEVVTPASLGTVTFRHKRLNNEGHNRLVQSCWKSGKLVLSSTILEGEVALRACPIHPGLTDDKLQKILRDLSALADEVVSRIPDRTRSPGGEP